ncbi:COBW domain-containing protein 1 [Gracilariopsis chorda]|uniref:COBW domain-containing protein 1 n=1 Tax=Gracilariopsis chorda TaxID=448386 RepID=A0A2V3J5J6_9FLOR|nr:COBW domain-containing protein 1 [Gracilariopsis chorda]|eukprot:PXF49392.1 COBW domain-containing protein 1 [Gracilariopsis chorda]
MNNDLTTEVVVANNQAPSGTSAKRVGITLVTGLLGAGKSTLIRRILTENHTLRIVVIENEFADNAAVEEAIVTQGVGIDALEGFIELPNGCICCAAQDDLTDALQRLLDKKRGAFDHVLIEASGVADPGPVISSFWVDEGQDSDLYLDAVVAVVDCVNLQRMVDDDGTRSVAGKQMAIADVVLLNKIDLLQDEATRNEGHSEEIKELIRVIREQGCKAQIVPTSRCNVELHKLFNIHAYESEATLRDVIESDGDGQSHAGHESMSTTTVTFEKRSFDAVKLDRVVGSLLWESERNDEEGEGVMEIWRMKALVVIADEAKKWIYQSVHTLFDSTESSVENATDDVARSTFIFIGRQLRAPYLRETLQQAVEINRGRTKI